LAIVLVGLNHRTAPVELREKLTLSHCALHMALEDLRDLEISGGDGRALNEVVILSTCNRLEIYASTREVEAGISVIQHFLGTLQDSESAPILPYLYDLSDEAAIEHLMRVACGLDSMILGEPQILGQVTQAFEEAHSVGVSGPVLSHLFARAVHAGKHARTDTPISRFTTSVSHIGALKVVEELPAAESRRVLIVGAGEMAGLVAGVLKRSGISEIAFINRTFNRAEASAHEIQGRAFAWSQLGEALIWADAVVTATGAPHIILYRRDLEEALSQRAGRSLLLVDIAVPRDIEDTVRDLAGVRYYDIDDLQSVVDAHVELRKAAIPQVEAIIRTEMAEFSAWHHSRQVVPVIKTLREWAELVAADELEHTLNRLADADARTREIVGHLAHRLVNRLLHQPITNLRQQAAEGNGYGYAHAVRELFALDAGTRPPCLCEKARPDHHETAECTLQCIVPPLTS